MSLVRNNALLNTMLPVCRRSIVQACSIRPSFAVQQRWESSASSVPPVEPKASATDQLDGILNILERSKMQETKNTDGNTNASAESGQANEGKTSDNAFDLSFINSSLSRIAQAPCQLHINAAFNNTILTLTRPNGSPLVNTSGGTAGFKKAQRSGYEAAHQAALQLLDKVQAKNLNITNVHIVLKGFGPGRDAAYKALVTGSQWNIRRITDATPVPFGGCRPKKARRL
ncbi:hypothetical protein CLU79DRAFT_732862 [Phycomyces nitens]|nr:hypothetical protein CLU79DRAFT_732862 [Phycomyces nitens]